MVYKKVLTIVFLETYLSAHPYQEEDLCIPPRCLLACKIVWCHCYCCNCRFQFCCRCRSTIIDIRFFYYYLLFVLYQASFAVTMMTIRVLWIACAIVGLVRNNLHYVRQNPLPTNRRTLLCCSTYGVQIIVFIVLFSPSCLASSFSLLFKLLVTTSSDAHHSPPLSRCCLPFWL